MEQRRNVNECGITNPTVSLIESAFSLSKVENKVRIKYLKEYRNIKDNFEEAIILAMKKKWLEYLLKTKKTPNEIYNILKELTLFINYKKEFLDLYLSL